jgi:acetyl-CoA carboxylase biotin carboxyl carrier protein
MSNPAPQDIFDVRKIRRLVELMKEHDLTEIDLQQGEIRIQLRRAGGGLESGMVPATGTAPAARPSVSSAPEKPAESAPSPAETPLVVIKSPMVGTFYAAHDPESPPYVKVGDHIGPETTVCIVEAMKVFNEIPAEIAGKIVAVLVENGQPVEFGQPLFRVDPRG